MEHWKDIEGFEGVFQISSEGRLRRLERVISVNYSRGKTVQRKIAGWTKGPAFPRERAVTRNGGYYQYNTFYRGKQVYFDIHREVAKAFLPNPDSLPTVNHKDGNKHNNRAENLEWMSFEGQMQHAKEHGLLNYGAARNEKISAARRKLRWYTDGAKEICISSPEKIPHGWKPGRLKRRHSRCLY